MTSQELYHALWRDKGEGGELYGVIDDRSVQLGLSALGDEERVVIFVPGVGEAPVQRLLTMVVKQDGSLGIRFCEGFAKDEDGSEMREDYPLFSVVSSALACSMKLVADANRRGASGDEGLNTLTGGALRDPR